MLIARRTAANRELPPEFAREERHIQRRSRSLRRQTRFKFMRKQTFHTQRKFLRAECGHWTRAAKARSAVACAPGSNTEHSGDQSLDTTDTDYGEGPSPLVSTDSERFEAAHRQRWYEHNGFRDSPPSGWESDISLPEHYQ